MFAIAALPTLRHDSPAVTTKRPTCNASRKIHYNGANMRVTNTIKGRAGT
jgi:hypothetical protein